MLIIAPDIMQYFKKHNVCGEGRAGLAVEQHEQLLQFIIERNPEKAGQAIKEHLNDISEYVKTIKNGQTLNGNGSLI